MNAGVIKDRDGVELKKVIPVIHTGSVERVVVAGQQEHRNLRVGELLDGAGEHARGKQVVIEDIPGNDHCIALLILGDLQQRTHGLDAVLGEAGLGLAFEEPSRHAQLPV